jgi:DNA-binding MarR family transcriptional regulator
MDANTILNAEALLEAARNLTPLQRQIVQSLYDKGPCLLLELAVRVLKFPEEVSQPVQELRDKGVIRTEAFSGGQFGGELLSLSEQGREIVHLLRNEVVRKEALAATKGTPQQAVAPDPRQQEIELLRKLGALAEQSGDVAKARDLYEEALKITRTLSAVPTSSTREPSTP